MVKSVLRFRIIFFSRRNARNSGDVDQAIRSTRKDKRQNRPRSNLKSERKDFEIPPSFLLYARNVF